MAIDSLIKTKINEQIIRSKIQWAEEGERCTKYFLNLEKHNSINKAIFHLKVEEKSITGINNILNAEKEFYNKLYSKNPMVNDENIDKFLNNDQCIKLTEEEKLTLEDNISDIELKNAIKHFKNRSY